MAAGQVEEGDRSPGGSLAKKKKKRKGKKGESKGKRVHAVFFVPSNRFFKGNPRIRSISCVIS